jgi:hypothetical protein
MNLQNIFYNTLFLSVVVQITTGIVDIIALFAKIDKSHMIIKQLLILELIVQIIEGSFYFWLVNNFKNVTNVTPTRYIDWSITTPTMLIQLIVYLIYLEYADKKLDTSQLTIFNLLNKNSRNVSCVLYFNWLMLLCGYLSEVNPNYAITYIILGFIPFLLFYYTIYINYAIKSKTGWKVFWYFFFFWSLYGVAAFLPYYIKNAFYNILDLFSKNFFGIFLSYLILSKKY